MRIAFAALFLVIFASSCKPKPDSALATSNTTADAPLAANTTADPLPASAGEGEGE